MNPADFSLSPKRLWILYNLDIALDICDLKRRDFFDTVLSYHNPEIVCEMLGITNFLDDFKAR